MVSATGRHTDQPDNTATALALQLLEEYQAKRLGVYRVPHAKASAFFEPDLDHCPKYNKAATIDDKKRTLGYLKDFARGSLAAICEPENDRELSRFTEGHAIG